MSGSLELPSSHFSYGGQNGRLLLKQFRWWQDLSLGIIGKWSRACFPQHVGLLVLQNFNNCHKVIGQDFQI